MPYLEVPAASLYYETIGQGPLLLCISGANGDADPWKPLAEGLKDKFTAVTYDRRGYSRSFLSAYEPQDYEHRLETDADDVARLIKHLDRGPAIILGNSFGAIVSLVVLLRHPDVVETLVPHEPQATTLLPDDAEIQKYVRKMYETYRKSGLPPAYKMLCEYAKLPEQEAMGMLEATNPKNNPYNFSNAQLFWEREAGPYTAHHFEAEDFAKHKEKLHLVNSQMCDPEALHCRPNLVLAEKLGLKIDYFPGGHLGWLTNPKEFAEKLVEVLSA